MDVKELTRQVVECVEHKMPNATESEREAACLVIVEAITPLVVDDTTERNDADAAVCHRVVGQLSRSTTGEIQLQSRETSEADDDDENWISIDDA